MSEKRAVEFDKLQLEVSTMEGGHLLTTTLLLEGAPQGQSQRIVTGKPGSPLVGSRIRRACKGILEEAFPKAAKLPKADVPGQQVAFAGAS